MMGFPTIIIKTPIDSKSVANGIAFVSNTASAILMTQIARDRVKIESIKDDFLNYLKTHKEAYTSEIMEDFNLDMREVDLLLKKLKAEGKIRIE